MSVYDMPGSLPKAYRKLRAELGAVEPDEVFSREEIMSGNYPDDGSGDAIITPPQNCYLAVYRY